MTAPVVAFRTHPLAIRAVNRVTRERFRKHARPLPRLTLSQWAEKYRVLSPEASAQHGPWRNDVAPYLVEVMDALGDRSTQEVVFVAPSQSGKSEVLLNALGYFIHQEPSPALVVQPTVKTGESFSKDRIAPMLRDSTVLGALVSPAKSRDSKNTIESKQYPGGQLDITGANAPSGLAMRPKRFIGLDERDRHPRSAGKEGDVKRITRARTRSYRRRRKIYEVSSPTDPETSLIWPSYLEGTQEVWEVPCPSCQHYQTLHFERLRWEKDAAGKVLPESVVYECASCSTRIPATARGAMIRAGRWRSTGAASTPHKRSFRLHGLCAAFALWEEIAQEFVSAETEQDQALRADQLRAFFNTTLGELYKDQIKESAVSALVARGKPYSADHSWQVPRQGALIAAGLDLQHAWGEMVVRAYGVGEESWLLERVIFHGDTSQPDFWMQLEEFRTKRTWLHESGVRLGLRSLAIDAGDGTHASTVYKYCAPRIGQHVYAIKGSSNPAAPITPSKPTKVKPGKLFVIGVNAIMERLYRRLSMVEAGPGYMHMNEWCDEDYATQLLSMRRVIDPKTRKRKWEATEGIRNEVADAETYCYLAFLKGPVPLTNMAAEVERVNAEGKREKERQKAEETATPAATPIGRSTPPRVRGGFVRRF